LQTFAQTWFVTLPCANNSVRQKNLKRELDWRLSGLVGLLCTLGKYLARKKKGTSWELFLEKETWHQTSFTTKFGGKTNLGPIYFPLL
jgi:hypothetical protein